MPHASPRISPTGAVTVVLGVALVFFLARAFLAANTERTTSMQSVGLVAEQPPPPPPTPTPPEINKPDDDRIKVFEHVESDQWAPTAAGAGPPGPGNGPSSGDGALGLAEAGEGGGDAFGLAGKPGGRELLLTGGGGGGGGGNPYARFTQFADRIQSYLQRELNKGDALRHSCYVAEVYLRVTPTGEIQDVRIRRSTGQSDLDAQIRTTLRNLTPMDAAPPADMPWPVGLRIDSRRDDCPREGAAPEGR
jgi:periplasmic protein TonB